MEFRRLELENFRNFLRLDLALPPGKTVLCGRNAQGKSNLLEALYLFAAGRSMRASHERELLHWQALQEEIPFARARATIQRAGTEIRVEIVLQLTPSHPSDGSSGEPQPLQKRVRVNGLPRRAGDLAGVANAVLFSPQDIEMVYGSPAARRRYLDITLSQVDRPFLRGLHRYERVLAQRNALLKAVRERRASPQELSLWDGQLVEAGSFIILHRLEALGRLGELAQGVHRELAGGQEELALRYLPSVPVEAAAGDEEVSGAFQAALARVREKEVQAGVSLVGPHRDDFQFLVNGVDLGAFGSRGQQRTAALALRLAEARFMEGQAGQRPVLLLDDVLSELDAARRGYLLAWAQDYGQVLLTTAEPESVEPGFLAGAALLQVAGGRVERLAQASR